MEQKHTAEPKEEWICPYCDTKVNAWLTSTFESFSCDKCGSEWGDRSDLERDIGISKDQKELKIYREALVGIEDVAGFMETIKKAVEVFKECHDGEYSGNDSEYVLEIWESVDSIVDLFPKTPEGKEVER